MAQEYQQAPPLQVGVVTRPQVAEHAAVGTPARERRVALIALGAGNAIEWYDWQVYGVLAPLVAPAFFPARDEASSVLLALAVFAVGFAARPLGAVVLGTVADRIGRKRVMLLSVAMMAAASLVIGLTPKHASIGVWAGVAVLAARLLQGVSTGVEAPLNSTYAVELAPSGRVAWFGGITSAFVYAGLLSASLVPLICTTLLGDAAMKEWGWRIPFVVGGLVGLFVMVLRRTLPETHGEPAAAEGSTGGSAGSVWRLVGRNFPAVLAIVFIVAAVQAFSYGWSVGLPARAQTTFHEPPSTVFLLSTLLMVVLLVLAPLTGRLADRVRLPRAFVALRLLAVPVVFLMLLYQGGVGSLAVVLLVGGVVLAGNMALYNTVSATLVPKDCRATGVGLGYAVGVAVFGGTAPYLVQWLQGHGLYAAFPVYVAVLSLVSVCLYLFARRRGHGYAD